MFEEKIAKRSKATPPSFIRAMLKVTANDKMISFAGGLPNPISFPEQALKESANRIIEKYGSKVFQYSQTAGLPQLREYLADKLNTEQGMRITADDIIVTTGSQQALDMIGKVLIDEGDTVIVEEPSYLGAIQAFSQYQPSFAGIPLEADGMNMEKLEEALRTLQAKFIYAIPNFQNPSGLTYAEKKRQMLLDLAHRYNCILIEDDPYGDLKFEGTPYGFVSKTDPSGSILLGTFSKTVTPGMRLGYMVITDPALRIRFNTAKEAADLHSNIFAQYLLWDYVTHNDLQAHIKKIRGLYKKQCEAMLAGFQKYFPKEVTYNRPEGGMFIWATLPAGISAVELFEKAQKENVIFVPGNPFYTDGREASTMRMNYTNCSEEVIDEGMKRLGNLITSLM